MSLRDAVLTLRDRAKVLEARLTALTEQTQGIGGGCVHTLVEQVDEAAVAALRWVKQVRSAVGRAARPSTAVEVVQAGLTEAQGGLNQRRRKEPRRLWGRQLGLDLTDLWTRHELAREPGLRRLGAWARDTRPLVRAACFAARATDEA